MMRRTRYIRTLVVALAAVFAFSAVAVASASAALPEFYHCVPKTGGKWMAGCLTAGTTYEKEPVPTGSKIPFTSTSGEGVLETVGGHTVKCKKDTDSGEITGPKTIGELAIKFTECKASVFSEPACETAGAKEGEIIPSVAKGELGYIKATSEVGVLLAPTSGTEFAKFECKTIIGTQKITVTGSVICHVEPLNEMKTSGTIKCEQEKGLQKPTKFEGLAEHVLMTTGEGPEKFGPEQSGEGITDAVTFAEAVEVKT